MRTLTHSGLFLTLALAMTALGAAERLDSLANTDGVLTWQLGALPPGKSARQVVLFAFDSSYEKVASLIEQARREFRAANVSERSSAQSLTDVRGSERGVVWIKNAVTDFALDAGGAFFWEGKRQSLTCQHGGQLSRFGYYVHYDDGAARRAGTPILQEGALENLRVVEPVRAVSESEAIGTLETADGKLRLRVRAVMGAGATAAVEFTLTNISTQPVNDVRLSAYSNLESAHTHENDYSVLDSRTGGVVVIDPPTGFCVVMAGPNRPATGYSGTWASQEQLQNAIGVSFDAWKPFGGLSADLMKRLAIASIPHSPAPYVEPNEPPTRTLTEAEANAVLERDYLFQAEDKPLHVRAVEEIRRARELAARLMRNPKTPDLKPELTELDALEKRLEELKDKGISYAPDGSPPQMRNVTRIATNADKGIQNYFNRRLSFIRVSPYPRDIFEGDATAKETCLAVRRVKRRIMFKNPVVNFSQVLFIDVPYPQGAEWAHQARHRNGMMAVPGGRLLVLDGLSPAGKIRKLAPEKPGSFWRPDLSFDAKRVLFCYKAHDEKSFHLYEIGIDEGERHRVRSLRQLTFGDYDDLDPIYLPDGHIMFTTTRGNTYVRCMPYTYSYVLARCDADGKDVYLLSHNSEPDWLPTLLNDGRVIYSRWEYTDKALWRIQSLWTANPDGTQHTTFWGNQSVWPDHLAEARPIPGSPRVMFAGVAHHDWFAGSIGIIDPRKGFNFPKGLTKVTADVAWPECGTPPVDPHESPKYHASGRYTAYKTPYPLSEEDFLVSARGSDGKFRLYLMDVHGNRELIYEGTFNVLHAMPVAPRKPPPAIPDRVVWPGTGANRKPPEAGVFFSTDVYEGVPDLLRGSVKFLRVIQQDAKTYSTWTRDARFSGPSISILQEDAVKRILGTVPVEADGSVHFKVPPGRALFFQLLDERCRALQTMRSFVGVMPGERRGCVGCHEARPTTPPTLARKMENGKWKMENGANSAKSSKSVFHSPFSILHSPLALRRPPSELTPPPWGTQSISYERFVQPVLDRHCGPCHQGKGEARAKLDLTLRPGHGPFKEPYVTLVGWAQYSGMEPTSKPGIAGAILCENCDQSDPNAYVTYRPMKHLSYTSKLVEIAMGGKHYDVKVDPLSLQQLIAWVDANCPYRGEEDVRAIPDPMIAGLPIPPRCRTAPVIERP